MSTEKNFPQATTADFTRHRPEKADGQHLRQAFVDIKKKKILVVNNDPISLKLILDFLTTSGHDTTCVNGVFGCLQALVEMIPDVIFIDLTMPRIGDNNLCQVIRSIENMQDCYLVIISGVAQEPQHEHRYLGADTLIAKGPFSEMRLQILEALADSEKNRSNFIVPTLQGAGNLPSQPLSDKLLQSDQNLQVILENMAQGIIELCGEHIVYVNPQAAKFLGCQRKNLLGRPISESCPPLRDALALRGAVPLPQPVLMQVNGHQITLELLPPAGDSSNIILMLSDITERRQMEAVIEAANLTKNLGYVFSGIRHEIGNPVNSIKMALSVLQRNLAEYDLDTIALFVDRSLQEVTRLEYLLKALKNYSLFERPVMQELPVADFLINFIALIKNDFENHDIKIHRILPESDLLVQTDNRALHHIMLNLITNAADALGNCQNPQIIVSAKEAHGRVEIKVDDNGKGISEADQQNLFKPFFTSKTTGTGLGLVIVKKMLMAMKGEISIESYEGMGTTVTVTLPRIER